MSGILQIQYKRPLAWPPTLIVHALGERASRHAGGADGKRKDSWTHRRDVVVVPDNSDPKPWFGGFTERSLALTPL